MFDKVPRKIDVHSLRREYAQNLYRDIQRDAVLTTVRTAIHGTTVRRVTTMNHLVDIFNDSRTRMGFVNDVFIIISKNGL